MEKINYKQDWNKICATFENFTNLQESPAWFWNTESEAKLDLLINIEYISLNDIWLFVNKIAKKVEEWEKEPIRGYVELKIIEKVIKNALNIISNEAYDDFGNWNKDDLPYWYVWNITNRLTIKFEEDEEYSEIKEKLKNRESILKNVVSANEKWTTINDSEWCVIECPDFSYKASLVVKKWITKKK